MNACANCDWRTACNLRTSGNAHRCRDWKSDSPHLVDWLMIVFAIAMFAFALGVVPLALLAAKGF